MRKSRMSAILIRLFAFSCGEVRGVESLRAAFGITSRWPRSRQNHHERTAPALFLSLLLIFLTLSRRERFLFPLRLRFAAHSRGIVAARARYGRHAVSFALRNLRALLFHPSDA